MKRKTITLLIITVLFLSTFITLTKIPVANASSLFESFNEATSANSNVCDGKFRAQTFTSNATFHTISSIKLKLYVTSAGATYNVNCSVKATDVTGKPSGSVLTSGIINSSTITTNSNGAMYEFLLTQLNLNISTKYAIVLSAPDSDASNYVRWFHYNLADHYAGGTEFSSIDSGSTWSEVGSFNDLIFEVYGREIEYEAPTYTVLGHSGATGGVSASFYMYANDNVELGTYIFSYKIGEGSYTNLTGTSFASTPGWANLSRTLPTQNATFYFKYYFSDSFGNWNTTSEESFAVTYISAPTPTATPTATPTPTPTGTPAPTPPLYVGDTSNLYFRSDTYTTLNVSAYGLDSDFTDTQVTSNTASDIDLVQYGIRVYLVSSDLQKTELTNTVSAIITLTHNSTGNVTGLVYGSWIIPSKPVILGYQALQVDIYSYTPNSLWTLEKSFISPVLITKEIYSTQLTFALYVNTTFITPSTLGGVSDFNSTFIFGSPDYKSGLYGLAMSVPLQSEIQLWRLTSGDYVGFEIGAYYDLIGGAFYVLLLLLAAGILYFRYGHFGTVAFFFVFFGGLGGTVWLLVPPWAAGVVSAFVILGISFIVWRLIR